MDDLIPGLHGARRQEVAAQMLRAWREDQKRGIILTGFSGVGKTVQLVQPLLGAIAGSGGIVVLIDAPQEAADPSGQLLAALVDSFLPHDQARATMVSRHTSFVSAVAELMNDGALVVVDEFQHLLDRAGSPGQPLADGLRRLAEARRRPGGLWLVANREIDPTWSEAFHSAVLEAPTEEDSLDQIVLDAIGVEDAQDRFPIARRREVTNRLGANPRALRLLGRLVRNQSLDEVLPPEAAPETPVDPRFAIMLERTLVEKAEQQLANAHKALLSQLTVLREPATPALLEALGGHLGDVRTGVRALADRYLVQSMLNRERLHPLVREVRGSYFRRDAEAWKAANLRAGRWYARALTASARGPVNDAKLPSNIAGAEYHLTEAGAKEELRAAIASVTGRLAETYHWRAPLPSDQTQMDAQIRLLTAILDRPGSPTLEYRLASLLFARNLPGDHATALPHADRGTKEVTRWRPWHLRIRLLHDVRGPAAAAAAAGEAVQVVAADYGLYLQWAACLNHAGELEKTLDALLQGAKATAGSGREGRLIEAGLAVAAAEETLAPIERILQAIEGEPVLVPPLLFGRALVHEHEGDWRAALMAVQAALANRPNYIHAALHHALCWLALNEPDKAFDALDRFPRTLRYEHRSSKSWIASLVALHKHDLARASELLELYLGEPAPTDAASIRAALLRAWDHRVGTLGEANPALEFPILPPTVTALAGGVRRRQYGPAVLAHAEAPAATRPIQRPLQVLVVATEWASKHGGLSTLNRRLCKALSDAGLDVVCLVEQITLEDLSDSADVRLIQPADTPGVTRREALSRKPALPQDFTPDIIIGHSRMTGPAAQAIAEHFPQARRLHFVHMAPDEIEWFKPDSSDDAGLRAQERTKIEIDLGRTAFRTVAVGPRLHNRYRTDLEAWGAPAPWRLDPGFDVRAGLPRKPPEGSPWRVLMIGRLEDGHLKGLDLAARAVADAAPRRLVQHASIELRVRGVAPGESEAARLQMQAWTNKGLEVVALPYSNDAAVIAADLRGASLVLMPSRKEGFGLVGLEAIEQGLPVLISSNSGLAELLEEVLPSQAARIVVEITGDDDKDADTWSRAVERVLGDRKAAFRHAEEARTKLVAARTWAGAIEHLLADLRVAE